ncbi:MAG: PKD domain-containing protein, partial [Dolichospermum sp.]
TKLVKPTYSITFGSSATISYPGSPYCQASSATPTITGVSGGTFSSNSGLSINSSTGTINLANSNPGTYTVTYTYSGTCTATASITINANTFSNSFSINTTPQCLTGNSFTFTNNSGTSEYSIASASTSSQTYNNQYIVSSSGQAIIFRMYVYGGSTRKYGIQDFTVTGSTSAGAITAAWPLTSSATASSLTGAGAATATAQPQTLGSGLSQYSTYGSSTTGISVPSSGALSSSIDYTGYIQFSVTPNTGYILNVSSISFTEKIYLNSGTVLRNLMYSTDGGITFQAVPYNGASQSGLTFSWNFGDGSSTVSSTSPTYSYTSANTYPVSLTVSDGACSSTTTQNVTVNTSPSITTQPSTTNQSYCLNATPVGISVVASGSSLTYQWYKNVVNSNSGGSSISGATSSTYTPSTTSAGTFYYYCVVSSLSCTTTSNVSGAYSVYPTPVSSFTINTTPQCLTGNSFNYTTASTDTSTGIFNCNWALTSNNTGASTGNGSSNLTITNFSVGSTLNKSGTPSYNTNGVNVGINSGNWLTDASSNNYIQFQLAPKNNTFLVVDSIYLEGAVTGGASGIDINVINPQISVDGGTTFYSLTTQSLNATSGTYTNLGFKLPASVVVSKTSNVYFRIY